MKKKKETEQAIPPHPQPDGRYEGKNTGYEVVNGQYFLAPCDVQSMSDITDQEAGLYEMIAAHNRYLDTAFKELSARKSRWWKHVLEDLRIDTKKFSASYQKYDGCVTLKSVPPPEPEEKTA